MMTKSIRVSNFNHKQLEKILNKLGLKHKPVCNQVECHPYLNQSKLLEFCKSKDILLVADTSLGSDLRKKWVKKENPVLLQDPVLNAVAEKHWRTPAQVALCYQLQQGVVALAKNFNEKRIKENFQVFEFQLTPEDMGCLDGLNRNIHYFDHDLLIIQITHFMRNINNCVCGCSRVLALVLMIKAHLKDEKVPALLDIT